MINVEKVSNGWIIRGKNGGVPTTWVAITEDRLIHILNHLCDH